MSMPRLIMFALVLAVNGDNLLDTFVIGGNGKGHGVIFLIGTQSAGRNNKNFIGDRGLGNMELAAPDNDSVAFLLHDAHVHVRDPSAGWAASCAHPSYPSGRSFRRGLPSGSVRAI